MVGPGGTVFEGVVEGGSPSFALFDEEGQPLPDGTYYYELAFVTCHAPGFAPGDGELDQIRFKDGSFRVAGGRMATPSGGWEPETEAGASGVPPAGGSDLETNATFVEVVSTLMCLNAGCSEPESYPTIDGWFARMKMKREGVSRILVEDDRADGTDWALVFNSGSAAVPDNYVAIKDRGLTGSPATRLPFRIDAGAPSNSLRVISDGRIGLGTAAPTAGLHLRRSGDATMRLHRFQFFPPPAPSGNDSSTFTQSLFGLSVTLVPDPIYSGGLPPTTPLFLLHGSPSLSLVAHPMGVGVHRDDPAHRLDVLGNGATSGRFDHGTLIVERNDGAVAKVRFRSAGGPADQSWLFQNNPSNQVFAIRDETGGSSPFRIFGGSPENNFVARNGRWGLNVANPAHPIDTSTGAVLTAGGVWQNASSRALKEDVEALSAEEAIAALVGLEPIKYRYKAEPNERYVGFITEDVPELVATTTRTALSSMDVVAVLTRAVQEQQAEIERLLRDRHELEVLRERLEALEGLLEASTATRAAWAVQH